MRGQPVFVVGALVCWFFLTLVGGRGRSLVDWSAQQAVVLQSDDWGLPGFVARAGSWSDLDREALQTGRFPAVYWESTLETADNVNRLANIMDAHRGRDGLPAIWQPNYIMTSMSWNETTESWNEYALPAVPPAFHRTGLWTAVDRAVRQGVWQPELHGFRHYDSIRRLSTALSTELAREVTRRDILLFPHSEAARELSPTRPAAVITAELDTSLAIFERVFGRSAVSVIAPDYTWTGAVEDLWQSRGLYVIQAKREQRDPTVLAGKVGRLQKYIARHWVIWRFPGRIYLERNCRLEPVQAPAAEKVVAACLEDVKRAWSRSEPAIVESHRVNYAHIDSTIVELGMSSLSRFLDEVCDLPGGPVFLCDSEVAQLRTTGVSVRKLGDSLVVRNGSHAARLVLASVSGAKIRLILVPAGESHLVCPE